MINFDESLFFNLYKANLDLWLKTCLIFQEGRDEWLTLEEKVIDDNIEGTHAAREQVSSAKSWQELMALPGDMMWRRVYARLDEVQLAADLLVKRQTGISEEYKYAIADWQKASVEALREAGSAMPLQSVLKDYWRNLGALGLSVTKAATTKVAETKSTTPVAKKAAA